MIITTPQDQEQYVRVLGDGSQWGIELNYKQPNPDGLAQAFILAESYLEGAPSALILGDNVFFGHGLTELLNTANNRLYGATVFGYQVTDPHRYGVVGFDEKGKVNAIIESPNIPPHNMQLQGCILLMKLHLNVRSKFNLQTVGNWKSQHLKVILSRIA